MARKFYNLDADESIFFARELEFVKAKTFDILFPELKARDLIPVSFEAGPGAESITYQQFNQVGIAKIISNYADDLPRADVAGKEFTAPVKSLATEYGWNLQEIRAAQMAGRPLPQRKANSARQANMTLENKIAWFGDVDSGLQGFLSNPNVNTVVLPADGAGSSKNFADKTPEQVIRDLNSMATAIHSVSKGVEFPDTLLLPIIQYNFIFTTPRATGSDKSIGAWFLENSPHITSVDWLNEIQGSGSGGEDQMVAYRRNPDKLTMEVPQDFEQMPVQERGLEFLVPVHQRFGGVLIYYPLSVAIADDV